MRKKEKKKEDIHSFIKKRKYLIWWTKNWDRLSESSILEVTLNYGNWDDVQELFKIMGLKKAAKIFRQQTAPSRWRCNYHPKTKHYFNLYFNRYVPPRSSNKRTSRAAASSSEILSKL